MKALRHTLTISLIIMGSGASLVWAQDNRRLDRGSPASESSSRPERSEAAARSQTAPADLTQGVHIASVDIEDRSLRRYAGQTLWNTEGAELGTIKDFIVHPASGRIHYVAVSSGGVLGMGNSLRLVPVEVLRRDNDNRRLAVDILHSRWVQIPPVNDSDYIADRLNITPTLHREMTQRFGSGTHRGAHAPSDFRTGDGSLVRASTLRGKTVQAAGRTVGRIENILIDLDRSAAVALLDSTGDFTGTDARYVIPLPRLNIANPQQDPIVTTLTREDFDRAQPSH